MTVYIYTHQIDSAFPPLCVQVLSRNGSPVLVEVKVGTHSRARHGTESPESIHTRLLLMRPKQGSGMMFVRH